MIGSIRGRVLSIDGLTALIELSSGIGYEVEVPASLLTSLKLGEECFLYIHHVTREDAELLYGFASKEARLLFREVVKINGVGPRIAMAILSCFDLNTFIETIMQNRVSVLVSTPGIGKKTAERIIVEMRDRIDKLRLSEMLIGKDTELVSANAQVSTTSNAAFVCDDAIAALVSLGYKESLAMSTVKNVYKEGNTTEEIIVAALAMLSKH